MKDFFKIIKTIKEIKGLKYDKQVVELLGLNYNTFITGKHRNTIPYDIIIDFCYKENISLRKIFYDENTIPSIINKPSPDYQAGCNAHPVCQDICKICESLPPDGEFSKAAVLSFARYMQSENININKKAGADSDNTRGEDSKRTGDNNSHKKNNSPAAT